jgi:hypothetical protein
MDRRAFVKRAGLAAVGCGVGSSLSDRAASAPEMPTVPVGELTVSRFIVGGNPFSGQSHQSGELSNEMLDWYTTDRVKQTLEQAADEGVNTCLARGDRHIQRLFREYWNEGGRITNWIAQTAPEYESIPRNIKEAASAGAKGIYIQGAHVDRLFAGGRLEDVRPWLDEIRERGAAVGVGSHRPEVLRIVQDKGWPADFYMQCFYNLSERNEEYLAEDREKAVLTIRQLEKPTIAFKILAAGRNDPEEAFSFAFKNIKATDAVCVGVFPKHRPREIAQDAQLTRRYGSWRG